MTDDDRRQCPLLRCRKRFPNHELMLRHLYSCEQLAAGEYWCYDCEREERFADARTCKRCLGHPSKRRKIVGMAKNFFRDLGHKSRSGSLSDLDLVSSVSSEDSSPSNIDFGEDEIGSWDDVPTPERPELQGNEVQIHEIDSNEVPLPTIWEEDIKSELTMGDGTGSSSSITHLPRKKAVPAPRTINPVELETVDWNGRHEQMPAIAPRAFWGEQQPLDRPTLQVQTNDLTQYRAHAQAQERRSSRSKMLAPSSSVRSTASTDSTNSTASTNSYAVSVMSNWSNSHDYASALTTPAEDSAPNPFKPSGAELDGFDTSYLTPSVIPGQHMSEGDTLDPKLLHVNLQELPADIPMIDVAPPYEVKEASFDSKMLQQQPVSLDSRPPPTSLSNGARTSDQKYSGSYTGGIEQQLTSSLGSANTLIKTAWEALQLHISESMKKLRKFKDNNLVSQLQNMTPGGIASTGLRTLLQILAQTIVDSPVQLLCFVHLAYSFSIVVHEQDVPNQGSKLFKQAVSYASWLSKADRHAYLPIVDMLWKPADMSRDEVQGLMRKSSNAAASRAKGQMPIEAPALLVDALAFVSQFFLDELEYAALQEKEQGSVQASDLCIQHMKDTSFGYAMKHQVEAAVEFMLSFLVAEHSDVPQFVAKLAELKSKISSNYALTARRLELDLMHIGKGCLPSETFFDRYIPSVRSQVDSLYSSVFSFENSRRNYHRLGIGLIELMINGTSSGPVVAGEVEPLDDINFENLLGPMAPNLDNFDFSTFADLNTPFSDNDTTPADLSTDHSLPVSPQAKYTSTPVTAGTSPPSHGPTPTVVSTNTHTPTNPNNVEQNASNTTKVESDSCCDICGYRPEGDPRWFQGSMSKHKKLQHAEAKKIYKCPYPGCKSQYTNRPDNLRQHQLKKGHFVQGEGVVQEDGSRPCKRKKFS